MVASNPACSSVLLDRLLREPTDDILHAVAGNPSASSRTLMHIARFKSLFLRAAVAGNPSFRVRSYRAEMLLCDRDGLILAAFARRTNVSGSFLRRVEGLARSRARRYPMVLMALKSNPTTPKRLRRKVNRKLSAPDVGRVGRMQLILRWIIVCMAITGIALDPRGARALVPAVIIGGIWGIVRVVKQHRRR